MPRDNYIRVGFSEQEMEAIQIKMAKVRAKTFQSVIHALVMAWCEGPEKSQSTESGPEVKPPHPLVRQLNLLISSEDTRRETRAIKLLLEGYKPPEKSNEEAKAATPTKGAGHKRGA